MSRTTVVRDEEVQPVTRGRNQEQLTGPLPSVGGGGANGDSGKVCVPLWRMVLDQGLQAERAYADVARSSPRWHNCPTRRILIVPHVVQRDHITKHVLLKKINHPSTTS